jgi:hypothetical protein
MKPRASALSQGHGIAGRRSRDTANYDLPGDDSIPQFRGLASFCVPIEDTAKRRYAPRFVGGLGIRDVRW